MSTDTGPDDTGGQATSFDAAATEADTQNGDKTDAAKASVDNLVLDASFDDRPELAEWVKKIGVKSMADLAQNARHTQSQFSKLQGMPDTGLPGEDATAEQLDRFYSAVGRPDDSSGYSFDIPEGTPEDFPYDDKSAGSFKEAAYANGLRPEQAKGIHDWFVKEQVTLFSEAQASATEQGEASAAAQAKTLREATSELEEAFDAPSGSPTFNANLNYAQRFFRENGGNELTEEMLKIGALVEDDKGVRNIAAPKLFAAIAAAGRSLYAEGNRLDGDNALMTRDNPWKEGSKNITRQHQIQRQDPQRASRLKAAAGVTT